MKGNRKKIYLLSTYSSLRFLSTLWQMPSLQHNNYGAWLAGSSSSGESFLAWNLEHVIPKGLTLLPVCNAAPAPLTIWMCAFGIFLGSSYNDWSFNLPQGPLHLTCLLHFEWQSCWFQTRYPFFSCTSFLKFFEFFFTVKMYLIDILIFVVRCDTAQLLFQLEIILVTKDRYY